MIVVIGILAAITIVAYNGIQQRAVVASIQSDLEGAAKQLAIDQVTNSTYPATTAAANGGQGLKASSNNSYSYTVNTAANPQTFCIAETNGSNIYSVTSTNNVPTASGCVITNLILNPSAETSSTGMYADTGSPTIGTSSTQAKQGTSSFVLTSTVVSTDVASVIIPAVQPGIYTLTYYVYSPVTRSGYFDECDQVSCSGRNGAQPIPANIWTRISATFNVSGTVLQYLNIYLHSGNGPNSSGNSIYIDGLMLTSGTSVYNYADGNTQGWTWNGTANSSTSTGRQL